MGPSSATVPIEQPETIYEEIEVTEDDKDLATRLYAAQAQASQLEDEVCDKILAICGFTTNPDLWPFHDITYDDYDGSFELKCDINKPWKPTEEQMQDCFNKLGFTQAWICYGDRDDVGYHENYYARKKR